MFQGVENTTGNTQIDLLLAMHRFRRPKGSPSEKAFLSAFLAPLECEVDPWGNIHKVIPQEGGKPSKVLWSSHTDTVHHDAGMQRVHYDGKMIVLNKKEKANCLGSDDAAGVYVMMRMIMAKIPGHYIFHFGEEKGCEGSRAIFKDNKKLLKEFDYAIAFDRQGFGSIITHMGNTRTCSDAFANSIKTMLPHDSRIDTTGRSTDTKQYETEIPECTNLSVGYFGQHTSNENLNVKYLLELTDKMLDFDEKKLVKSRDPKVTETRYGNGSTYYNSGYGGSNTSSNSYTPHTLEDVLKRNATVMARILSDLGITLDTVSKLIVRDQKDKAGFYYDNPKLIPPQWLVQRWEREAKEAEDAEKAKKSLETLSGTVGAGKADPQPAASSGTVVTLQPVAAETASNK